MKKTDVGILGATGVVGQRYVQLLADHPWFRVSFVAASPRSSGKTYEEAVAGRWLMTGDIPAAVKRLRVYDAGDARAAGDHCRAVFSAVSLPKPAVRELEETYAAIGLPVISNNSAHRVTADVPVLIPEINAHHLALIPIQQSRQGWSTGFIVVKPNCSIQSYMTPLDALRRADMPVKQAVISTMQGISGAGYPGVAAFDLVDNLVPYISGEEEKSEQEPQKIFGQIGKEGVVPDTSLKLSVHCNRVSVIDGHTACVSLQFENKAPPVDEIRMVFAQYRALPQELALPSAPINPIVVRPEADRPQPRRDRDADKGMAVSVGRIRACPVLDVRFVGLSHNTIRGAAGGGILNAELLKARGYL